MLKKVARNVWYNPVGLWCLAFILINLIYRATGGANPASRYATMRAMVEQHTFEISSYKHWTVDWGQNEDGKIFSNKAPGPMFIGLPLFFILEKLTQNSKRETFDENGYRNKYISPTPRVLMSLTYQMLPFAFLVFFLLSGMKDIEQINFTCLALFFGTTTSLLMNVYFGHAMASIFILGICYAFLKKKYYWVGFCFGFALMCEYTAGLLLLPLLIALFLQNKKDIMWMKKFILGGFLPGILWCLYHYYTTGSIFLTPAMFQNPDFESVKNIDGNFVGMFLPYPDIRNIYYLLFGSVRGLLFTQPWLLFFLPLPFIYHKDLEGQGLLVFFIMSSFALLLVMNSMFDAWHSGWMVGPRYMCMIFPAMAWLAGKLYPKLNLKIKYLLWLGLFVAVAFRALVYATTILAPDVPLWPYLFDKLHGYLWVRVIVFYLLIALTLFRVRRGRFWALKNLGIER